MTPQTKNSLIEDIKAIGVLLGVILAIGGAVLAVGKWFFDLQSREDAISAHKEIKQEIIFGDKSVLEYSQRLSDKNQNEFKEEIKELRKEQLDSSAEVTRRLDRILYEVKQ